MYLKVIITILKFSRKIIINEIIEDSSKFSKIFNSNNDLFDIKKIQRDFQ